MSVNVQLTPFDLGVERDRASVMIPAKWFRVDYLDGVVTMFFAENAPRGTLLEQREVFCSEDEEWVEVWISNDVQANLELVLMIAPSAQVGF